MRHPDRVAIAGLLLALLADARHAVVRSQGQEATASVTYLGGSADDYGRAIAMDGAGNVYLVGTTSSSDFLAPIPLPPSRVGELTYAPFLLKLDASGAIVYGAPLPGSTIDAVTDVAVAADGSAFVALNSPGGPSQLIKIDRSGSRRIYEITVGGAGQDSVRAASIAVDRAGRLLIAGTIGFRDAFVAQLDGSGQFVYQRQLGGRNFDEATDVAVDAAGSVYIVGTTVSDDFPTTTGSFQPRWAGGTCYSTVRPATSGPCADGFIVKFNSRGELVYSSYIGGTNEDNATGVDVDRTGAAYIVGRTQSRDFPTLNALQSSCKPAYGAADCGDTFVARVHPTGSALTFATYLGSNGPDFGRAIAVEPGGKAYITGFTNGNDLPLTRAVQPANGGGPAFVSPDGGTTWTAANGLEAQSVRAFARAAGIPPLIYAATDRGVFRSADGGRSWNRSALQGVDVHAVAVDPQTPAIVYAGTLGAGAFKSVDGGETWTAMSSGLVSSLTPVRDVTSLAVSPAMPSTVYAGTQFGVFRSDDGGSTWHHGAMNSLVEQGALAVDPRTPLTVFAGIFGGVLKSTDGARTWRAPAPLPAISSAGLRSPTPTTIVIDPTNSSILYAGIDGGVTRSRDGGLTWTPATQGLPDNGFYRVALDGAEPETLYAAALGGVYRSRNSGDTWEAVDTRFLSVRLVSVSGALLLLGSTAGSDGFVIALDANGRMLASTYLGGTWEDQAHGITVRNGVVHVTGWTDSPLWPLARGGRPYGGRRDVFWARLAIPISSSSSRQTWP